MKYHTKYLVGVLLIFLVACTDIKPAPTPDTHLSITLEACHLTSPGLALRLSAKCGKFAVYEDPKVLSNRKIELNIAIIPAISRNPAPDAIFFLAGGPGESATASYPLVYSAFQYANQKRDIVLVDQRGTGKSNPLNCPGLSSTEIPQDQENIQIEQALLEDCLKNMEADPKLYTTPIAIEDLDQVRAALGYPQVNLYGASYGTRAALAYARQHPERLRTMILDGVVPMNWTIGPSIAKDAQRALDLIFDRCASDVPCQLKYPNLEREFQAVLERLTLKPENVSLKHPLSGEPTEFILTRDLFTSLVHTSSYAAESAALLPLMIHTAYELNDFSQFAALALSNSEILSTSISQGMRFSVICAEDAPFMENEISSPGYLGDFYTRSFLQICKIWPRGEIPDGFKLPVHSEAPTLLLSGEADPVTPPSNAELAAQTLPKSLHIVVPKMGHVVIFRGCIPKIITNFIENASVEGLDTSCVKDIESMPFFLNLNGPQP